MTSPAVGKQPPLHGEPDRWNPTLEKPVLAILVDGSYQVIPAEGSKLSGRSVSVEGALRYAPAPAYPLNGRHVEPLSSAQAIRSEDGKVERHIYQPSFCVTLQYKHIVITEPR